MKNGTSLGLLFLCALALLIPGGSGLVPNSDQFAADPAFFQSTWYLAFYLFLWNFLFEISLVIVLHFKQNAFYVAEHSFINMMVLVGQLINNAVFFSRQAGGLQTWYFAAEAGLTAAAALQLVLGALLNRKLQSERLVKGIFILRFLHKGWGRLIYLATKVQIAIYAFYYLQGAALSPAVFLSVLFGLTAVTHVTLWLVLNARATDDIEVAEYLINSSPRAQEYADLLRSIDAGEIDYSPEIMVASDRTSDLQERDSQREPLEPHEPLAWVIIEDKVFDITGLRHPKGNYILKAVKSRDITREIYGVRGWRFSEGGYVKVSRHRHVARTFEFLKRHCIGDLMTNGAIASLALTRTASMSENSSNLNLFTSQTSVRDDQRKNRLTGWKVHQTHSLSRDCALYFVCKDKNDFVVNLSSFWLRNFGKYFFARDNAGNADFYFVTLSLSPKYLLMRRQWHQRLGLPFLAGLEDSLSGEFKALADIHPELLKSVGVAGQLAAGEDVRDPFLPLVHYTPDHRRPVVSETAEFRLNGPIGLGNGLEPNSTRKILIVVRDSGILPFTDLLEYLGQRALMELTDLRVAHPIFGKEYLLYYINEVAVWLYWEISEDFAPLARLFGLFGIEALNQASKDARYKSDESSGTDFTKIINVVKRVGLVGLQPILKTDNKITNSKLLANDFNDVLKTLAVNGAVPPVNRVIVSGDMLFVNRVLKNSTVPANQVVIL